MTKENCYCDDPNKVWKIIYKGISFDGTFVSAKNARREIFPELNFEAEGKEFIVQFDNFTDLWAARDTGNYTDCHVTNLNRSKRIKGVIKNIKKCNYE